MENEKQECCKLGWYEEVYGGEKRYLSEEEIFFQILCWSYRSMDEKEYKLEIEFMNTYASQHLLWNKWFFAPEKYFRLGEQTELAYKFNKTYLMCYEIIGNCMNISFGLNKYVFRNKPYDDMVQKRIHTILDYKSVYITAQRTKQMIIEKFEKKYGYLFTQEMPVIDKELCANVCLAGMTFDDIEKYKPFSYKKRMGSGVIKIYDDFSPFVEDGYVVV